MPQSKITWQRGKNRPADIVVAAGAAETQSDTISLNVDYTKLTKGDVLIGLDVVKQAVFAGKWPPASAGSGGGGGGGGTVVPFVAQAETTAIVSRFAAVGATPMTTNRVRRLDRAISRAKAAGIWSAYDALYMANSSEAGWQVNLKNPGTNDLIKVGTPTFQADRSISTTLNTNYYDTGITLGSRNQDNVSMGIYTRGTVAVSSAWDCGAVATGSGLAINVAATLTGGTGAVLRAFGASNTAVINAAGYWSGFNWHQTHRRSSAGFTATHHGTVIAAVTQTSVAPAGGELTRTLKIGLADGTSTAPGREIVSWYVTNRAFTDAEAAQHQAIWQDYYDSITFGEPYIEEVGIGTASVTADVIVYGLEKFAIQAAYEAARQGLSVALVGAELDETISQLGGQGNTIQWIDAATPSRVSGLPREFLKCMNTVILSRADTTSQGNLSIDARTHNLVCRRALDATRTGTLPGFDIKVYMSGGAKTLTQGASNSVILTTNDGRTFTATHAFIDGSAGGETLPLSGESYIQGTEASGTGEEAINGYKPQTGNLISLKNQGTGTPFIVDPYNTAGVPGSGLLPDVLLNTQTGANGPDPALQSMNFRLTILDASVAGGNALANYTPMLTSGSPPSNYSAARAEKYGRLAAAATAGAETVSTDTWMQRNDTIGSNNANTDFNSLDRPQSGLEWVQSTTKAQRITIMSDVRDYMLGVLYWTAYSGDARIPATRQSEAQGYSLHALTHLDPPSWGWLYWPPNIYQREPRYQLVNSFAYNANDVAAAGGTTPRSTKIISNISYRDDKHDLRLVAHDPGSGGIRLYRQGAIGGSGINAASVPAEVIFGAVMKNYCVIGAPAWTKTAHSAGRMEFTLGLLGQGAATYAAVKKRDGLTDITAGTYTNGTTGVRELMQAAPYGVAPVIPLTNG